MALAKSGLTNKTINRHISNVDFYINEYLMREDTLDMESGTAMLDGFLEDFFRQNTVKDRILLSVSQNRTS